MIKNKNYMMDNIMGDSRHQFIYGFNGKDREEFLKDTATKYSIKIDESNPVGIYISDNGLPDYKDANNELDEVALQVFHSMYSEYLIMFNVLNTALKQIDVKTLDRRSKKLLERINSFGISKETQKLKSLVDLKNIVEETKELFYNEYNRYIKSGTANNFYDKVKLEIMMDQFIEEFKMLINNNSYVGIIFDQQKLLSIETQKSTNNYIACRSNKNMSIKVACEPQEWETFYTQYNVLVESIHDYGEIELDNSYSEYIKTLKKRYL